MRRGRAKLLRLLRVNLLPLCNLRRLSKCLRMLQLGWLLGGCTPRLVLLELLAEVRLRLRLRLRRDEALLQRVDVVLGVILRRVCLRLLGFGLLCLLVVALLMLRRRVWALGVQLSVARKGTGRVLGVEGLVFAGTLRRRDGGLVRLVLLLGSCLLLWL
jgi:hypothetical protein